MFRKLLTRLIFILVTGTLLAALFWQSGNYILGASVRSAFANGTGCSVSLHDPRLFFFPLRARVSDIAIVCPEDMAGEGFFARDLTAYVHLNGLFQKRLRLPRIEITGVRSQSSSRESAFMRTIIFIVEDSPPADPYPWHGFLSHGWKVIALQTHITSVPGAENLRLQFDDLVLRFQETTLQFDDFGPTVRGQATSPQLTVEWAGKKALTLQAVDLDTTMGKMGIVFDKAIARIGQEPLTVAGKIDLLKDRLALELKTALQLDTLPMEIPEAFRTIRVDIDAQLRGGFTDPVVSGILEGNTAEPIHLFGNDQCNIKHTKFRFDIDKRELRLHEIFFEGSREDGAALLRFDEKNTLDVMVSVQGGPSAGVQADTTLAGRCLASEGISELQLHATGQLSPIDVSANLVGRHRSGTSKLKADGRFTPELLTVQFSDSHDLQTGSAILDLTFDPVTKQLPSLDISLKQYPAAKLFDLALMAAPDLPGLEVAERIVTADTRVSAELSGSSTDAGFALEENSTVEIEEASLLGIPVSTAKASIEVNTTEIAVRAIEIAAQDSLIKGELSVSRAGALKGNANVEGLQLSDLTGWSSVMPTVQATLDATLEVSGTTSKPVGSAVVRIDAEQAERGKLPTSEILLQATEPGTKGTFKVFGEMLAGDFSIEHQESYPFAIEAQGRNIDPRLFLPADSSGEVSGEIDLRFDYKGSARRILETGTGGISWENLLLRSAGGQHVDLVQPTRWGIRGGTIKVEPTELLVASKPLRLSGDIDLQKGWNLQVAGDWELAVFAPYITAVSQLSGRLLADLRLVGALGTPTIDGTLAVRDGSFAFPVGSTVFGASGVEIDTIFKDGNLTIQKAEAQLGDGTAAMSGVVENVLADSRSIDLRLALREIDLEPVERLFIQIESDLTLQQLAFERLVVGGDVRIVEGAYEDNITMADFIRQFTRFILGVGRRRSVSAARGTKEETPIGLALSIRAADGLLLDTNVAQAELRGKLNVSGTTVAPRLFGAVEVIEGTFGLRSNSFDVIRGRLLFEEQSREVDPRIDLVGESQVSADGDIYTVRLSVTGTVSRPTVRFDSDGGLSDREILSLLGGGSMFQRIELVRRTGDQGLSTRNLLTPGSEATLEERITGLTGFTSVEVGPAYSQSTGDYVPKLFATRRLPAGLDLELTSELVADSRTTVRVEYRLSAFTVLSVGWKSISDIDTTSSSSGSFAGGIHYRRSFPGVSLLPPEIRWEVTE